MVEDNELKSLSKFVAGALLLCLLVIIIAGTIAACKALL